CHYLVVGIIYNGLQREGPLCFAFIAYLRTHHNLSSLFGYRWRGNKCAPMVHMHRMRFYQPHIAVYARTRIPSGVGLFRVIDFYGDSIGLISKIEIGCQRIAKRNVTIGSLAQIMAVYPYFAAMIDAIEIDKK